MEQFANTDRPTVSVVVTCYNYGHYLKKCLDSVCEQTYRDFEIILVDDGSTDSTPTIAQDYTAWRNFRYFRQSNGGQARAKNFGIKASRGHFVAFLDADDFWEKDKLELQMPLFHNERVGVVYSRARYVDSEGEEIGSQRPVGYLAPKAGRVWEDLFMDNFVPFSSSVIRMGCLDREDALFDESLPMGIDWDLWLRLSVDCEFAYVDAPLLFYRQGHPGQMSRKIEVRQACSDRIMGKFMEEHPRLLSRRCVRKAFAYTYCNRGYYFRQIDYGQSYRHYLKALGQRPWDLGILKGMGGTLLHQLGIVD